MVKGRCEICGKIITRSNPVPMLVLCDCCKYCPLCGAEMTLYTPDLNPRTYRDEDNPSWNPLGLAAKCDASVKTLYVCRNHSPPYYSSLKPVEVLLL